METQKNHDMDCCQDSQPLVGASLQHRDKCRTLPFFQPTAANESNVPHEANCIEFAGHFTSKAGHRSSKGRQWSISYLTLPISSHGSRKCTKMFSLFQQCFFSKYPTFHPFLPKFFPFHGSKHPPLILPVFLWTPRWSADSPRSAKFEGLAER